MDSVGRAHEIGFVREVTSLTRLKVAKTKDGVGTPITKNRMYTDPAIGEKVLIAILLDGDRVVVCPIA